MKSRQLGTYTCTCSTLSILILFFFRFDGVPALDIFRIIAPDVVVIAVSITCVICCRGLISSSPLHQHTPQHIRASPDSSTWDNIMPYFIAVMLLVGGIMLPSLASAIYFIMFLILGTMWACHKAIRLRRKKAFAYIRFALMVYSGIHVITFYLYQFQFFQSSLPPDSLLARWVLRSMICSCCAWNSLECCFSHVACFNQGLFTPSPDWNVEDHTMYYWLVKFQQWIIISRSVFPQRENTCNNT